MALAISTKKSSNPVNEVFGKPALKHSIALYVPSTFNVDEHIDNRVFVASTRRLFSEFFGGATSFKATGSWVTGNSVVNESVVIVKSYSSDDDFNTHNLTEVLKFAGYLKEFLRQEAITLEIDNQLYFI